MKTTYSPGKWLAICDVCGFRFYNDQLRKDWRNLMVCEHDWESRHPQDLIRVPRENIAVAWARPESVDQFIPVVYICTTEGRRAIAGIGVAGCAIAGSYSGVIAVCTTTGRTGIVGLAVAGCAITGTNLNATNAIAALAVAGRAITGSF